MLLSYHYYFLDSELLCSRFQLPMICVTFSEKSNVIYIPKVLCHIARRHHQRGCPVLSQKQKIIEKLISMVLPSIWWKTCKKTSTLHLWFAVLTFLQIITSLIHPIKKRYYPLPVPTPHPRGWYKMDPPLQFTLATQKKKHVKTKLVTMLLNDDTQIHEKKKKTPNTHHDWMYIFTV